MRQDPQVLVVGEIRDEETANVAVRAALTGHLSSPRCTPIVQGGFRTVYWFFARDHSASRRPVELVLNQRLLRPGLCPAV